MFRSKRWVGNSLLYLAVFFCFTLIFAKSWENNNANEFVSSNTHTLTKENFKESTDPSSYGNRVLLDEATQNVVNGIGAVLPVGGSRSARILLFPPIVFESHVFIFKTLAKGVQKYGHHVTLYVSDRRSIEEDSPDFSVRKFPGIFSTEEGGTFLQSKITSILNGKPTFLELFDILAHYSRNCDVIFSEGRDSIEQLRREKYDLLIVDPNEMCGFLLAKELGIPHVVFSTGMWVPYESNSPSPTSYVPEFNSLLTDRMNFFQRFYNTLFYGASRFVTSYLIFPIYNRLIIKHKIGYENGRPTAYIADMIGESQSWLLSTDLALEFPRAVMPNTEFVGGITAHPPRALPQGLQDLADQSASRGGFIIVSFGAGVKRLNAKLEAIFVNVLSRLPYLVLWRYPSSIQDLGSNVKLVDWLPQADLIAHPNLRVFVGHGGTNGVYECIYNGAPIIGMPLFGDQYDSMARVQAKGAGILLNWKYLTEEKLQHSINEVATNPKYRQAAQLLSQIHHDQPLTALDRASRRIDYTIRYNGASHLKPAVYDLSLWQFFLVDVQLALIVILLALGWLAHWSFVFMTSHTGHRLDEKIEYSMLMNNNNNVMGSRPSSCRYTNIFFSLMDNDCCNFIGKLFRLITISLVKAGALLVLQVCSGLRFLAVHMTFHCGKCTRTSRTFLRCLNFISRKVGNRFVSRKYHSIPTSSIIPSDTASIVVVTTTATTTSSSPALVPSPITMGNPNNDKNSMGSTTVVSTATSSSISTMTTPNMNTSSNHNNHNANAMISEKPYLNLGHDKGFVNPNLQNCNYYRNTDNNNVKFPNSCSFDSKIAKTQHPSSSSSTHPMSSIPLSSCPIDLHSTALIASNFQDEQHHRLPVAIIDGTALTPSSSSTTTGSLRTQNARKQSIGDTTTTTSSSSFDGLRNITSLVESPNSNVIIDHINNNNNTSHNNNNQHGLEMSLPIVFSNNFPLAVATDSLSQCSLLSSSPIPSAASPSSIIDTIGSKQSNNNIKGNNKNNITTTEWNFRTMLRHSLQEEPSNNNNYQHNTTDNQPNNSSGGILRVTTRGNKSSTVW